MKMANTYNPYSDVKSIYDLKGQWDEANKAGDTAKKNQIAATAQAYYDNLKNNNYSGVAKALSASDYQGAKSILDSYSPTTSSPVETNNLKSNEVNRENAGLFDKYNEQYDYITKTNPFTTEEAKAVLGKYSLAGLQARDNAAANGGASNGGNIDSYAAANAMRQQASLISQGQGVVLDSHQQKIDNIRGLLSDMGVNIDRVFNQDETAKNNDVARKSEIASVTGYVPNEWAIQNDSFLKNFVDENGKLREEYNDTDFQALINSAKERGDTDLANKYAILRGLKIFGNFDKYGKYLKEGDVAYVDSQRTAEYDLTDKQLKSAENIALAGNEAELEKIAAQTAGQLEINKQSYQYQKELAEIEKMSDGYEKWQAVVAHWDETDTGPRKFVTDILMTATDGIADLPGLLIDNSAKYNLDVDDCRYICALYGIDDNWLDNYRDRTNDDGAVKDYNKNDVDGKYGGMVRK